MSKSSVFRVILDVVVSVAGVLIYFAVFKEDGNRELQKLQGELEQRVIERAETAAKLAREIQTLLQGLKNPYDSA